MKIYDDVKENITISEMTQLIVNNCKITTTCAGCPIFKYCNERAVKDYEGIKNLLES